jgi:hypothetical protein
MVSKTEVIQSTTTMLMQNKEDELNNNNGLFLFGYRFVDTLTEVPFDDVTYLSGLFSTFTHTYDNKTNSYAHKNTNYFSKNCTEVYDTDIAGNQQSKNFNFNLE